MRYDFYIKLEQITKINAFIPMRSKIYFAQRFVATALIAIIAYVMESASNLSAQFKILYKNWLISLIEFKFNLLINIINVRVSISINSSISSNANLPLKFKYINLNLIIFNVAIICFMNSTFFFVFVIFPEWKMVSRRKILSRSRDDLNAEQSYVPEDEEDVWYQKDKLFKVSVVS